MTALVAGVDGGLFVHLRSRAVNIRGGNVNDPLRIQILNQRSQRKVLRLGQRRYAMDQYRPPRQVRKEGSAIQIHFGQKQPRARQCLEPPGAPDRGKHAHTARQQPPGYALARKPESENDHTPTLYFAWMLKPNIFREYDIRGIADTELPTDGVKLLGQAIGTYLIRRNSPQINLARDCRLSSDRLRDALLAGLVAAGCGVTDLGVVPTPLLYYSVFHLQAGGGVMITGSHNPSDYNGFKVMHGKSTIHGEEIQKILGLIQRGDFETGEGSVRCVDVVTPYVDEISAQFKLPRRVRVVSDAGNGTAGPVFRRILEKLNCESTELFFDMDGRFPNHHPDPTQPENLAHLVAAVLANQADVGLAFDGDSDRIGAVDEKGSILYGDQLMIVYAREILSRKPGATIIGEVKSSQNMYDDIRRHGGNPIMWKTGHSLIKTKMNEDGALLAGEMSGHFFFADRYFGFDDAIYASLRLLEILSRDPRTLSEMLADVPQTFSTPELRIDCPDALKFDVVEAVRAHYRAAGRPVVDVDGARIAFGSQGDPAWGLVRASNTGPVLVLRFEATTAAKRDAIRAEVEGVLSKALGRPAAV